MRRQREAESVFLNTIRRHKLLPGGGSVIVALSGGADSVALFYLLLENRSLLGICLRAAHLNHGLRGAAADEDEAFVRTLCEKEGVPLDVRQAGGKPRQKGEGDEAFGRRLRYAFFEELAARHEALVATGHTGSDNAETVLFNAARGSFTAGLAGIPPAREVFIRPLLELGREEVRAFCRARGYAWREDETNHTPAYARNRLRLSVLPALEQVHPGAGQALSRLAGDMRELDGWLRGEAVQLLAKAQTGPAGLPPGWRMPAHSAALLQNVPGPVRLKALSLLAGPAADRAALARLEDVLRGEARATQLPGGKTAWLAAGRLVMAQNGPPGEGPEKPEESYEIPLSPGDYHLPGGYFVRIGLETAQPGQEQNTKKTKKDYTFFADYDKIKQCGILRTRRPKDRFHPPGRTGGKTLKKWMNEAGVDRPLRPFLPLIAKGETGEVLWVFGLPFCEAVQPGAETKCLLKLEIKYGGEEQAGGMGHGEPEYL